ncbi:MAG: hypothetical protein R3B70_18490 [Polyangiaceae bacterium]
MNKISIALFSLALGAFALTGCSPESKAKSTLEKYETVFRICKEETEKVKMEPGKHQCALVSSMALDMSLRDTGLDDAKVATMREEWLTKSGYKAFYIPADQRAPEHR